MCILPGFLRADVIDGLVAECEALAPLGHFSQVSGTPYIEAPDSSYPEGHPRRIAEPTSLTAVAYDLFPNDSSIRALYQWDPLMDFIAALLGRSPLYRYADPFGALNLAVDERRRRAALALRPDRLRRLDRHPVERRRRRLRERDAAIRSADDEHYDDVAAVLAGQAPDRVRTEPMTPGTLMVFEGRHSMHRVTPIKGDRPRYVALLAYDTKPDTDSSNRLKMVRYGRLP